MMAMASNLITSWNREPNMLFLESPTSSDYDQFGNDLTGLYKPIELKHILSYTLEERHFQSIIFQVTDVNNIATVKSLKLGKKFYMQLVHVYRLCYGDVHA